MARIAGIDLPKNKQILYALPYIYGIGLTVSREILTKANIPFDIKTDDLNENEIATPGDKEAYVVLKNPKGQVINAKGTFIKKDGTESKYTIQDIVNYENSDLDVVMLVERKGDKYEKGIYPIEVYVEGKLVGGTKLELGDSFLGL